jgi:hypothetical protein
VGGDVAGPVVLETPAGHGPARVKVGDQIRIRVSY